MKRAMVYGENDEDAVFAGHRFILSSSDESDERNISLHQSVVDRPGVNKRVAFAPQTVSEVEKKRPRMQRTTSFSEHRRAPVQDYDVIAVVATMPPALQNIASFDLHITPALTLEKLTELVKLVVVGTQFTLKFRAVVNKDTVLVNVSKEFIHSLTTTTLKIAIDTE